MPQTDYCPDSYATTYRIFYKPHKAEHAAKLVPKLKQTDEIVATGHHWNQLQVNGKLMKSKVFPSSSFGVEEYWHFVQRLHDCKKELYKMFFRCPEMRYDYVLRMLQDLEKTVYTLDYSPNTHVPLKQSFCGGADYKLDVPFQATTYRTYYNRIKELERYREILEAKLAKNPDTAKGLREINKLFLCGRTTYYETLCQPALYMLQKLPTPPGPIDRYTERRV